MNFLNIDVTIQNIPKLDTGFIPMGAFFSAYRAGAKKPVAVEVYRDGGLVSVYDTFVYGTPEMAEADKYYAERLVKTLLWLKGGYRVRVCGDEAVANHIADCYREGGARAFDWEFMARVYDKAFEVQAAGLEERAAPVEMPVKIGGHFDGCRIGFDAGGSDRKVSAVVDGKQVFGEEVVWHPKITEDPEYHYSEILSAFKTAASKMPRVDAIGVSSAGIYVDNQIMVASLFLKVPREAFDRRVRTMYIDAAREIGDVPLVVANDGDVTALAGAIDLEDNSVLGVAMGTSEAAGYIDDGGNITGWLNELAFVPVDCNPGAMADEWSGDIGCGVKYFSQDSVIKLAGMAGIALEEGLSPAEKLKVVQGLMEQGDMRAEDIYRDIGVYLGHTIPFYAMFYDIRHMLLLGRVMSGRGGELIVSGAKAVLSQEYPELFQSLSLHLPDEKSRRLGQSFAAASLPQIS